MNPREEASWELHQFFEELDMHYAIIGGVAVQIWGQPRLTIDVDFTVIAPLDQPSSVFIQQVLDRFPSRIENALEFARRSRVILITASNSCPVDISMGLPGYEEEVMQRAVEFELEPGKAIRVCSAEDLSTPTNFSAAEKPFGNSHFGGLKPQQPAHIRQLLADDTLSVAPRSAPRTAPAAARPG